MNKKGQTVLQNGSYQADSPVYPSMASQMKVDFLFDEQGKAWLLYDRPLTEVLKWLEYDGEAETITMVSRSGKIQDLGMTIPVTMGKHLEKTTEVTALYMQDGKIADYCIVPMISRNTAIN